MPLLSFWKSDPDTVGRLSIEQIVTNAGSGNLTDGSDCSHELREYLSQVPSRKLAEYVDGCLTSHLNKNGSQFKGGMVLQDLVNELGRRLDYKVTNGRYQGTQNAIGFDGIWVSPEGHSIVVEVKTTDAYRIPLDTIATYREKLLETGQIAQKSSVLIVVGRQDTGELEAQVRGSRHAWDMRLISADSLIKLTQLKEDSDDPATVEKIRSVLAPMEYTRLDALIDVMFTTAKDVESAAGAEVGNQEEATEAKVGTTKEKGIWQFTDPVLLEAKRDRMVAALGLREGISLIKKSRAVYWDASHNLRAVFAVSKRYSRGGYWYAYHPKWDQLLGEGQRAFLVLGCMGLNKAFAIPLDVMRSTLGALNTTEKEDGGHYWHVFLNEKPDGEIALVLSKEKRTLPLLRYELPLEE
jgi:hypothetical protein